jgi:predicted DNA-binding helix-hairpin-helix protein
LLRFYKFTAPELLDKNNQDLDFEVDPKCDWALRNFHRFPVEINKADYETLLRVPGIGVLSARRIVAARRSGRLGYEDLKKIGVILKRAVYFILCDGKFHAPYDPDPEMLKGILADKQGRLMASPLQIRIEDLDVLRV